MSAVFSFPDDFNPKVIFTLNELVEDQVPIISHQTKVSLYTYFPVSPKRESEKEEEKEKDAVERINVREKKIQELLSLSFSKLFQAISLYEHVRSTHGTVLHGNSSGKKILLLDMPIERQFACQAPDYRSICTPESAYLDSFNISNGHVKFIYLHSNGSLYAVYKTRTSMHVNLMEDLDDYLTLKESPHPPPLSMPLSLPPIERTSRELVTIYLSS